MSTTTDPTFCPTCETELPPDTPLSYFAQSPLCPVKLDLSFGQEVTILLDDMGALFNSIGFAEDVGLETLQQLGRLGCRVTTEAQRRFTLFNGAVQALSERADKAAALVVKLAAQ